MNQKTHLATPENGGINCKISLCPLSVQEHQAGITENFIFIIILINIMKVESTKQKDSTVFKSNWYKSVQCRVKQIEGNTIVKMSPHKIQLWSGPVRRLTLDWKESRLILLIQIKIYLRIANNLFDDLLVISD